MKKIIFAAFSVMLLNACSKNKSCSPNEICTMEFAAIDIEITNAGQTPSILDSYKVMKGNEIFHHSKFIDSAQWSAMRLAGIYRLADDGDMKKVEKNGTDVKFYGFRNGALIITEPYSVGHNCCHILLRAGLKNITTP